MKKLLNWLNHRTGYRDLLHEFLYERIPGGARWRYVWGSSLVFTFTVQVMTGIFLWTAYSPSAQTAWESVYYIQNEMTLGWLVRGIHHFAAQAMVVLMALHLIQVIIDGAYRAPREVNFWLGLILMQIVLGLSLTGYLLPWDQKGYYATKVATKIMGATPIVGPQLQKLVQGGPEYGHHTLTRFFAMHGGLLPALLVLFLVLHLHAFRRHGVTAKQPLKRPETFFWPEQVLRDGVVGLAVLIIVMGLAIYEHGAPLSAPANPAEPYSAARPEWYFMFLFQFLRFEWVEHVTNGPAFGAIYVPGFIMLIFILMPFIARREKGHRFNVCFTWVIAAGAVGLTLWSFVVDFRDEGYQQAVAAAERDAQRVKELAQGPAKIPVEGAITLLKNDPFTQGPRLFAKHCASCHRYNGHDGTGRLVNENIEVDGETKQFAAQPTAADLGDLGNRDWFRSLLLDYGGHFSPLKNAAWYGNHRQAKNNLERLDKQLEEWKSAEHAPDADALKQFSRQVIDVGNHFRRYALSRKLANLKADHRQRRADFQTAQSAQAQLSRNLDLDEDEDETLRKQIAKKLETLKTQLDEEEKTIEETEATLRKPDEVLQDPAEDLKTLEQQLAKAREWFEQLESFIGINILDPDRSPMAEWSNNHSELLTKNDKALAAIIEFLVAQGSRPNLTPDDKLVSLGEQLVRDGEAVLKKGGQPVEIESCSGCHTIAESKTFVPLADNQMDAPELTGIYSHAWLKDFLKFPAKSQHYGIKNEMPGFADRLSDSDLDLLVRWLLKDYAPTDIEPYPSQRETLQQKLKERPDYQPPAKKTTNEQTDG